MRLSLSLLAVTLCACGGDGSPLDGPLPASGRLPRPLFAADSAWNQRVDRAPVLAASDAQVLTTYRVLRGDTTSLFPAGPPPTTWPFMDVNFDHYSIPIFRADRRDIEIVICDYDGNFGGTSPKVPMDAPGDPVRVAAPAGDVRPAGPAGTESDGHLVLYDAETRTEWDFWQATTSREGPCQSDGGGIPGPTIFEAGAVEPFSVTGPGVNPDGYSSARATGTPLLAGLILPEDVEHGSIEHALAFAIPGLRNTATDPQEPDPADYFYPTSTTETDYYNTDPTSLAAGQRLRLRPTLVDEEGLVLDESTLAPITRMFLGALRTYGAIAVDNAGGFSFSAEDIHSARLDLPDDEVNRLIGGPRGTPLPSGRSPWELVVEALNRDLERIPFAVGPWTEGQDPAVATITVANFEVVEPATPP